MDMPKRGCDTKEDSGKLDVNKLTDDSQGFAPQKYLANHLKGFQEAVTNIITKIRGESK